MIRILCNIRALRKEKKLTQEELADKLGISRQSIISVESGKSLPSLSLALGIAELFDRAIEEIFNFHNDIKRKEIPMSRDLIPIRPFGLGRFFDEDWPETEWPRSLCVSAPAINVYEKADKIIVEAQIPGIEPENVKIDISENVLKISGETKEEKEEKDKNFYRREVSYGNFARSIALPANANSKKAEAEYNNGILKITMPKIKTKTVKTVKVKVKKK